MDTDHTPTINLYRKARDLKGIKKILIASGVRYDIAVEDPRYIKELAKYHVGGYLKIAPEHTEEGPLSKMMKPGMGSYYQFKELFDKYSKEAGKQQYLIPYFISAHPGTTDEDMVNMALWVKENRFKLDQVQNFYPSPLANATTMTRLINKKKKKREKSQIKVPLHPKKSTTTLEPNFSPRCSTLVSTQQQLRATSNIIEEAPLSMTWGVVPADRLFLGTTDWHLKSLRTLCLERQATLSKVIIYNVSQYYICQGWQSKTNRSQKPFKRW
jgi:radical SAM superfamily enzyme YgiQ (UPF0313 family)